MRRLISALIAILLVASAGCGGDPQPPEPNTPEISGASINVVTTYGPNDGGYAAYGQLREEFTKATGVEVIDNSADSTEEWKQGVISSFQSGGEPDVLFFFTGPDVADLTKNNKFVSIDEIRESYPDYASNINLTVLDGMKDADGNGYAIPIKGYWERLFVNTDIFEQLGLPLPNEYEELFEIAPSLLEAGYIPIAASLSEVPHYLFEAFLFNLTGPSNHHAIPADPDNPPQSWVTALEQFRRMYEAGMFPEDEEAATHAEAFELFQSKRAAMIIDGDWTVAQIRDTENTAVINFPAISGGPRINTDLISGFSMGFYITKKAWDNPEKRDAAVSFVQFITSNDSIMRLNVSGAAMPIAIGSGAEAQEGDAGVTPLRRSIDGLNAETTAFVSAAADELRTEARGWLFSRILPLAKGETEAGELLREFIQINNDTNASVWAGRAFKQPS